MLPRRAALLLVLIAASVASADGLDRDAVKKIEDLGKRWWQARPQTKFREWDPQKREALLKEAAAIGTLPEGTAERAREVFAKYLKKYGPQGKGRSKVVIESPYSQEMYFLTSGRGGPKRGLVVGLHGGGQGEGSANEPKGTWRLKKCMGMYPQGLVLTGDNWNTVHGEKQILTMIEIAKAQHDIDPDRVFVMGFSMGGSGSFHMAARFPDLFAGAAPCAGVVMARPGTGVYKKEEVYQIQYGLVPNLRNLPMYYFIGTKDDRTPPGTYLFVWDHILELRKQDPGGYQDIHFDAYEGLGHEFPAGEPTKCLKYLEERTRNTFPEKVVWEYARRPFPIPIPEDKTTRIEQRWFYWLHHEKPQDKMYLVAERDGNEFKIDTYGALREGLSLMLNPRMIDVEKDVVVIVDGEEFYRGKPKPDFKTVVESFDAKLDRSLWFDRRVPLWKAPAVTTEGK